MQKSTNNQFRLHAICPQCGELVDVEVIINTKFTEAEPETKPEEQDNDRGQTTGAMPDGNAEGADVRHVDEKGPAGTVNPSSEQANRRKSKSDKSTGGKAK